MAAWGRGECEVETMPHSCPNGVWRTCPHPAWTWYDDYYRRKPEPKLRPWTPEEAVGRVVRYKGGGAVALVFSCNDTVARVAGFSWRLSELLVTHEAMTRHEDGSVTWGPCGVEE